MNGHYEYRPTYYNRPRSRLPLLLLIGGVALLIIAVTRYGQQALDAAPQARPRAVAPRADLSAEEQATIGLFERCSKSVVYVSTQIRHTRLTFFGIQDTIETGTGSGFVWDDHGHVVTNFHVIQGADACLVTLEDGTTYDAVTVGRLPDKDIAVLRIDAPADKLDPIAMGTSRDLRVGQKVFAIGNPYGWDFTLTTGVVSALNRRIRSVSNRTIEGVIQTDAAINPGNSGGPLLDSAGRLIGMNTSIYSTSGSSAGIGFAVPVDIINRVVPQLISYGKVTRPGLGVMLNDYLSQRWNLDGVLVVDVPEGSDAEKAGFKPTLIDRRGRVILGDVIVKVNDIRTSNEDALLNALERFEIGDTVKVTVLRDRREVTLSVELVAEP